MTVKQPSTANILLAISSVTAGNRLKEKLTQFIKKPPLALCIIVWLAAAGAFIGTIVLAFMPVAGEWWALAIYAANLLLVLISVYLILTRTSVPRVVGESERFKKFVADYGYRSYVMCIASAVFNSAYAVFGTIFSILSGSVWLAALVWYHVAIAADRFAVFFISRKRSETSRRQKDARAFIVGGPVLSLVALAIIPVITLVGRGQNTYNYIGGMVIYAIAIATYSFIKLGFSLRSLHKARGSGDAALGAMKLIGFADALISLYTLQAVMLKVFDDGKLSVMNPITGAVIVAAIFVTGVCMLVKGIRMNKRASVEATDKATDDGESADADIDMIDML